MNEFNNKSRVLLPKARLENPNKYPRNWHPSIEELESMDCYEIYFQDQYIPRHDENGFFQVFIPTNYGIVPIRVYPFGGVDIEPKFKLDFYRTYTNEERHFIFGFILYYQTQFEFYMRSKDLKTLETLQRMACEFRDDMVPKRLILGDNKLYDRKNRRKLVPASEGAGTSIFARAIDYNDLSYNPFDGLKIQMV